MINPLFLRYGFLDSLRLSQNETALFQQIVSLTSFRCPLRVSTSALTRHSLRCYHTSRHYSFPSHVSTSCLFHNIYGTNFLENSKFSSFISPSISNRKYIGFHLGYNTEAIIYEYSMLTEHLLSLSHLSMLSPEILSLVFVNTIEIASSLYSLTAPLQQQRLAFYLPILFAICDLARTWTGYPPVSSLLFDLENLSSSLNSSTH